MSWWGKVVLGAIGLSIGGPLGGLVGLAIGHGFDNGGKQEEKEKLADQSSQEYNRRQEFYRNQESARKRESQNRANHEEASAQERTQAAFFAATFSIMGHIAKADGRVSIDEIRQASAAFDSLNLDREQRIAAQRLFNEGKQAGFGIWEVLEQFRRECRGERSLFRAFMTIQIGLALSDGHLHLSERQLLEKIATFLNFSTAAFESMLELGMKASKHDFNRNKNERGEREQGRRQKWREEKNEERSRLSPLDSAYKILDVRPEQTDAEIKNAYRRMMNQYHPDKLVARGLPQEMVLAATEKAKEIQSAWAMIKKERSIR